MKKAAVWPLVILLIGLVFGAPPAQAASATVIFSGPDKVKAGGTYTYTYEIKVGSAAVAYIMPVTASGAFEIVSGGDGLMYDTIPDNTSGSSDKGTIEVRVKDNAKPGDKGTLSASGEYSVLDENYKPTEQVFQGSFLASVVSGSTASPKSSPTPSSTDGPTSTPMLTPEATPTMTPAATSEATPTPAPTVTPAAALPAATVSPTPGPTLADTAEQQSQPPQDDGDIVSTQAEPLNGGGSVWLIAAIIAVIALAAGLMIVLYVRRAGPFKSKGAAAAARGTLNSVRRSSYRKRGRHRR